MLIYYFFLSSIKDNIDGRSTANDKPPVAKQSSTQPETLAVEKERKEKE